MLILKKIPNWSQKLSIQTQYLIIRCPCYAFGLLTSSFILIFLMLATTTEHACTFVFMQAVMYSISAALIRTWWISFLLHLPSYLGSYYILSIFKSKSLYVYGNKPDLDVVLMTSLFAFGIVLYSSFISYKQRRESFEMKEELRIEKERIRDVFETLPFKIIKVNGLSKEVQLNQKAHNMLLKYGCTFEKFSRRILNTKRQSLQSQIKVQLSTLIKQSDRYSEDHDFIKKEDYIYAFLKNNKKKEVEFEIQFSQRKSMSNEIVITLENKDQQRKLKEEKLANIYKNNLLRGFSHDLNTPSMA